MSGKDTSKVHPACLVLGPVEDNNLLLLLITLLSGRTKVDLLGGGNRMSHNVVLKCTLNPSRKLHSQ